MSREEAVSIIEERICATEYVNSSYVDCVDIDALRMAIKALEQPELIRCGKCKHSEHWYRDKARCFLWHEDGIDVFEDGYCNYAE